MKGGEQISENDNFVSLVSNIWERCKNAEFIAPNPSIVWSEVITKRMLC